MKPEKKLYCNNTAITPAIGHILMVAVIVVLGAFIISYALDTSNSLTRTYIVGTTAKQTAAGTIEVVFIGGLDADRVLYLNVSVNGRYYNSTGWSPTEANTFDGDGITPIRVGKVVPITDSTNITTGLNRVIVTARFTDGAKQVVLDTWV